jgi:hypothetical protein
MYSLRRNYFIRLYILRAIPFFLIYNLQAQVVNPSLLKQDSGIIKPFRPEILTNGFIDLVNNGQVNASARFLRLYIGEPGKFHLPLSVYSGVSANSFQNSFSSSGQKSNDQLISNFINPLSGLVNLSVDGLVYFKKSQKLTKSGFLYQFGEKVLTGFKTGDISDPQTGRPVNFLNSFSVLGLYFQTGAWERGNSKDVGVFWLTYRFISCYTSPKQIREFLQGINTNGYYNGYCFAGGIEINNLINFKVLYYKYIKAPEIEYYLPVYEFSFNYTLKN